LIYLDSSMYAMIAQNGDAEAVRSYLDGLRAQVIFSGSNFEEVLRAPDDVIPKRIRAITTVAASPNEFPGAYQDAQELLSEIRRCRPDWINKNPNTSMVNAFIANHRQHWRQLPYLSDASNNNVLEDYRKLTYKGLGRTKEVQKYNRKEKLNKTPIRYFSPDPDLNQIYQSMEYIEQSWRVQTAIAWMGSLWSSNLLNRDYRDFLLPYLNMEVITQKDFELMWLQCVEKHRVPRNYVLTRTGILQEDYRITRGNAMDVKHTVGMLGYKWFITTDKTFFNILKSIETDLRSWPRKMRTAIRPIAIPIVVDRSNPDTVSAIKSCLNI